MKGLTLIELSSEVESKTRLLYPVEIVSCWLHDPGRWAKLVVKPRTQATPTMCKTVLPGEETTSGLNNSTWKDISAHSSRQGLLCQSSGEQTSQQYEACDDITNGYMDYTLPLSGSLLINTDIRG